MANASNERIIGYWTERAEGFAERKRQGDALLKGKLWEEKIASVLPDRPGLRILDAGCGTGFLCFVLAGRGYDMVGIDLTPAMAEQAKEQARREGINARFFVMDAQRTDFEDESFDAVISRNLTWTLPDPRAAYAEWKRLLKSGGVLVNFDADFAGGLRRDLASGRFEKGDIPYRYSNLPPGMAEENMDITLSMDIGKEKRPEWDVKTLEKLGYRNITVEENVGYELLPSEDPSAPLFMITAVKGNPPA